MELNTAVGILAAILGFILVVSFATRARVFCQYLRHMTGIELTPGEVKQIFKLRGPEGVRELLMDLIIREDLKSGPLDPETAHAEKPASALLDETRGH